MSTYSSSIDLAGQIYWQPNFLQIQKRINHLVDYYLSLNKLRDRLQDLPAQFDNHHVRIWKPIDWYAINQEQILGCDREVFLSILIGTINTEAPIRGYTQTSRQYLEKIHPQMARFVGGIVAEDNTMLEIGLWEKEERQHTPALIKTYQQLTGEKIIPLFVELVQDEINHMTKFWGFGVWLFPESYMTRMRRTLGRIIMANKASQLSHVQSTQKLIRTIRRMMGTLNWNEWSWVNKTEFAYTFVCVMNRLLQWNNTLTSEYLHELFGESLSVRPGVESPMNIMAIYSNSSYAGLRLISD
jgi:hypothetical protein